MSSSWLNVEARRNGLLRNGCATGTAGRKLAEETERIIDGVRSDGLDTFAARSESQRLLAVQHLQDRILRGLNTYVLGAEQIGTRFLELTESEAVDAGPFDILGVGQCVVLAVSNPAAESPSAQLDEMWRELGDDLARYRPAVETAIHRLPAGSDAWKFGDF